MCPAKKEEVLGVYGDHCRKAMTMCHSDSSICPGTRILPAECPLAEAEVCTTTSRLNITPFLPNATKEYEPGLRRNLSTSTCRENYPFCNILKFYPVKNKYVCCILFVPHAYVLLLTLNMFDPWDYQVRLSANKYYEELLKPIHSANNQ
jgi:hypothetical protein